MHKKGAEMRFKRDLSAPKRLKLKKTYFLAPKTIKIHLKWSIFETTEPGVLWFRILRDEFHK